METTEQEMELEVLDEGRSDQEEVNACCSSGGANRT